MCHQSHAALWRPSRSPGHAALHHADMVREFNAVNIHHIIVHKSTLKLAYIIALKRSRTSA